MIVPPLVLWTSLDVRTVQQVICPPGHRAPISYRHRLRHVRRRVVDTTGQPAPLAGNAGEQADQKRPLDAGITEHAERQTDAMGPRPAPLGTLTADGQRLQAGHPEWAGTVGQMVADPPAAEPGTRAVFLITGISAAGKSTVAQQLAERLTRSVHVRGDTFRQMIVNGRVDIRTRPRPKPSTTFFTEPGPKHTSPERRRPAGRQRPLPGIVHGDRDIHTAILVRQSTACSSAVGRTVVNRSDAATSRHATLRSGRARHHERIAGHRENNHLAHAGEGGRRRPPAHRHDRAGGGGLGCGHTAAGPGGLRHRLREESAGSAPQPQDRGGPGGSAPGQTLRPPAKLNLVQRAGEAGAWTWEDLNLRPLPYQGSALTG